MPRTRGSFDFFFGGALATGGNGALCDRAAGGAVGGGGGAKPPEVGVPVGPVFFGSTAVGADDEVVMVAPKSGNGLLPGRSAGGGVGGRFAEVPCIVALGSKARSLTNKPPSTVQNF